ncbi:MAG: hypothetical protein JXB38_08085 [Anaerolineales bacterium]|nr:hypothetical protein [Anaerolineales bacterium]
MLKQVHEHIIGELNQGAKTDTIFVITAIVFNLIVLAINSMIAAETSSADEYRLSSDIVLVVFIVLVFLVNGISITALTVGKNTRKKLLSGLVAMYADNEVSQYYDTTLLENYDKRYSLFTFVIVSLAATAVLVPLIVRFL